MHCLALPFTDSCSHVTATGMGYNKDQAVHNALRNAVEQTAGIYLSSQTSTQNFTLVSDNISSNTNGYVASYNIIGSSIHDNFGLVELSVDACVMKGVIRDTLAAARLIYELKEKPLIMVIVDDYGDNALLPQRITAAAFEKYFLEHGFRVVDEKQMASIRERDKMLSPDAAQAAALGLRYGADIIVTGSARADFARETETYGRKYQMTNCNTMVRLIRTDVGDVLVSESVRLTKGADNRPGSIQFALQAASREVVEKCGPKLIAFWKNEAYNPQTVQMVVENIKAVAIAGFEEKLRKIASVRQVRLQYYEGNTAILEVEIAGSVNVLRNSLSDAVPAVITALSANRIVLRYGQNAINTSDTPIPTPDEAPVLEIARFSEQGLYASRTQFYATHPFGVLTLQNNSPSDLHNLSVSVQMPDFASLESRQVIDLIQAGATLDVPISVTLQEARVLHLSQAATAQARITVSAVIKGKTVTREIFKPIVIHDKNAFDWKDGEAIGAFLTPKAHVISEFAHSAINQLELDPEETPEKSFLFAVAVFDALSTYGVRYVKDPVSSSHGESFDHIQFPVETMKLKTGDCDDASVLFASLLESAGIETALILYADHVLIMFNTGVPVRNSDRISLDTTRYIIYENKIWIPIETTMLEKNSFQQAWKQASMDFRDAVAGGESIRIISSRKAMDGYSPLNVGSEIKITTQDAMKGVNQKVQADMYALAAENRTWIDSLKNKLRDSKDISSINRLGQFMAKSNDITSALDVFTRLQKLAPGDARVMNNLGNVHCLLSNDSAALIWYKKAVQTDSINGAIRINQGLCHFTRGDETTASDLIRKGIMLTGGMEKTAILLGFDMNELPGTEKGAEKTATKTVLSRKKIKALMQQSLDKVPDKKKSFPKNTLPVGSDPTQIRKIADMLIWL